MPLEKSTLTAIGHAVPVKKIVVIQSAFDVQDICVFEHMVYVSDSREALMNFLRWDFLAKLGEFINLRNPMLNLTVFPGKCVEQSYCLHEHFPQYSRSELCKVVTRFDDCTSLNASFKSYTKRQQQTFVSKENKFPLPQKRPRHWNLNLSCLFFT